MSRRLILCVPPGPKPTSRVLTDAAGSICVVDLAERFRRIEATLVARCNEAAAVQHMGDRGGNRETILRDFLREHLPRRFGVAKGEVITRAGDQSHAADIIIYDADNGPVLYSGDTKILPVEAVYGIIEVKSRLSKAELVDASKKVEAFKRLAPRELSRASGGGDARLDWRARPTRG